ncbi:hypothetical protein EJC49_18645 [Aquibium carbonis]|uniref:Uncharacterized protein n=1 Tax=Aquibium carbonis TaxID=2495581 RepID=A0A3R9ZYP3_9HYPH|nr:hypothetical protein [Aquibium carbonis]RST84856.1 hypothetical protein EJC49_18645 [Aquibium carbonis]
MTSDINRLTRRLAKNPLMTDYDFWRALRDLNDEVYALTKRGDPIPIELLKVRATLRRKRAARLQVCD